MSAATKAATLPEKAFGKAENSTFIRFLAYERRFFAPAAGQRKQRILRNRCKFGVASAPPTVSVPALKTDMEMTSATLPRVVGRRPRQARSAARRGARQPRLHRDRPRRQQGAGRCAERRQDADRRAAAQRADRRQQAAPLGDDGCQRGDPEERRQLRDRADAVGQHRLLLQPLRAAGDGDRSARRCATRRATTWWSSPAR